MLERRDEGSAGGGGTSAHAPLAAVGQRNEGVSAGFSARRVGSKNSPFWAAGAMTKRVGRMAHATGFSDGHASSSAYTIC